MDYERELSFFERLIGKFHLSFHQIMEPFEPAMMPDLGLRALLNPELTFNFASFTDTFRENTIYRIHDIYLCGYYLFRFPDLPNPVFAVIGPCLRPDTTVESFINNAHYLSTQSGFFHELEKIYEKLPIITNEQCFLALLAALGESIWGSSDRFSFEDVGFLTKDDPKSVIEQIYIQEMNPSRISAKSIRIFYEEENQLMTAVSLGQTHKAEILFAKLLSRQQYPDHDSLRFMKNNTIVLNTLLRKSAENGAVQPHYIDGLSARFINLIEQMTSAASLRSLQSEMIQKYCHLVNDRSLKGYSQIICNVLSNIASNLTADLSLRAQAAQFGVNPCYLSSLFKREVGMTLTYYVNQKRVEHAVFLLNTTGMQIHVIAQYCGIPDLNYFTKTFKKYMGKTPKEYRSSMIPYRRNRFPGSS